MVLKVYNTLTRRKEKFTPIKRGKVSFYSCGQTVYDDLHIGNARAYSNWDVIVKYLRWKGYDVLHVQNFTDVGHLTDDADAGEDKIEKRAKERKITPWELIDAQIKKYYKDTDDLNIARANIMPRATSVIPEMIEMIQKLFKNGYAYESGGNVYFDTTKFKKYGELARLKLDKKKTKARVAEDKNKKNYFDFALWLSAKKGKSTHVMNWDSPWGRGYPGWHLECSVMSTKFLGETIDFHGGGVDHIPVHHTNEIAQSEGASGKKFVNTWLHGEFITINGVKMSKSKGNFYTSRELIEGWGAMPVRYALVNTHYRKRVNFTNKLMQNAKNNYNKIMNVIELLNNKREFGNKELTREIKETRSVFTEVMDDDFNTSQALLAVHDFIKVVNKKLKLLSKKASKQARDLITELSGVLGLRIESKMNEGEVDDVMKVLINVRNNLRKKKDYASSDYIRNELKKKGIILNDECSETTWVLE